MRIADYAIGGMNMGWELPGMFDVAVETRKLSLIAIEGEGKPAKELPLPGEMFLVQGRPAFLITSTNVVKGKPWVWYAPTLPPYPAQEERWMFERFMADGISIAGIDVGESYGSPAAADSSPHFTMKCLGVVTLQNRFCWDAAVEG